MTFKTLAVLAILALSWMGCGVDEEPLRPRAATRADSGPDLEKMSLAERKEATAHQDQLAPEYFRWPAGTPGKRDAVADVGDCRVAALERESYVRANDLARFAQIVECMNAKGWELDKQAVEAHRKADQG